jgi:enterochelin esterase-like enzyme
MKQLRNIILVCMVVSVCMAITVSAREAPAAGARAGMGAAPGGAAGAGRGAMGGAGMMGMSGRGGASSPVIAPDNKVTFRLSAPSATSVSVRGDFGNAGQMTKDEQGVWSVTVGPLQPEIYNYSFNVDGMTVLDPSNSQILRDGTRSQNLLLVPGEGSDLYAIKDVPHGTLSKVWYDSSTFKMKRRMYVYTPPGYETSNEKYPIFYVLHGGGGDEDAWTTLGRVPQIFDNLIAAGKVKPMIIVMPNGNANQAAAPGDAPVTGARGTAGDRGAGAAGAGARGAVTGAPAAGAGAYNEESLSVMADEYVKSIGAFMDKNYRVLPGPQNRAITGLSMGGGQAYFTGMKNMDYYSWVGQFSTSMFGGLQNAGLSYDLDTAISGVFKDPATINKKLKLMYMSCGREDPRISAQKSMTEELRKRKIEVVYTDWAGQHEWKVWRCALADMAKLLFQDKK